MPITTETYEGTPDGMNLAVASQELSDSECEYAQDWLFHKIGETIMRGPVQPKSNFVTFDNPATGIVQTLDPNGTSRFGVLWDDGSAAKLGVLSSTYDSKVDLDWYSRLQTAPPTHPYYIYDSKSALKGGSWIGTSSQYDSNGPTQALAYWFGGNKADYSTGTLTVSRGGTVVTGSGTTFVGNAAAGMFLFGTTDDGYTLTYIGVVQSVDSNTQITLIDPSPYPMTAKAYKLQSLRGFCPRITVGRITTSTGSATVNGGATKFKTQGMATGTWNIYRSSDWGWVGKVSSVTSDIQLTLAANAALALNNERYIAIRADGEWSINNNASASKVGFLNATYAGRQWFANLGQKFADTSTIWFSDVNDGEAVDLSPYDGNFIPIGSATGANTPIKALVPAYNALLAIKDNEAYGIFGSSPSNFSAKKIEDDGTVSGMSAQPYAGGVIWAGRNGIYFYDGVKSNNMTRDKLGEFYKDLITTFDSSQYRMWSMVVKNHYCLFIENMASTYAVVKGVASSTPTAFTIIVNMDTGAITTATNLHLRGGIVLPASTGQTTWYIANGTVGSGTAETLGQTAKGPNDDAGYQGYKSASGFTMPSGPTATANSISAWLSIFTGSVTARAMLYSDNAGSPGTLLAQSADQTLAVGSSQHVTFPLLGSYTLQPSTKYWLAVGFDDGGGSVDVWSENVGTGSHVYINDPTASATYGAGSVGGSTGDNDFSLAYTTIPIDSGYICDGSDLFNSTGRDTITCDGGTAGPDPFLVSKKYKAGDSLRKKLFKQIAMNYLAGGGSLSLDTVIGLNNVGATSSTTFPATVYTWDQLPPITATWDMLAATYPDWNAIIDSVFRPKRIKFLKRTQHLQFRIYATNTSLTQAILGPFQLGYKLQRPGRI